MLRSLALLLPLVLGCSDDRSPPASSGDAAPADARPTSVDGGSGADADSEAVAEWPRPCPAEDRWPEGMACVPGGTFTLGFADGQPDEAEPGEVQVSTFFMDRHEVTNAEYTRCVRQRQCERAMPYRGFGADRQPIVAVSWQDAAAYCEMVGKRLPTEAEWERAASGPEHTQYPWGDEPGGCEKANITDRRGHGCGDDVTLEVGSKAPGYFGLFDMAGNVHEWVADWYSPCLRGCEGECGDDCFGRDPRGPCSGADRCLGRTKRSIRGGSWYWPEERARTTARRGAAPDNEANHRFGFRCARDLSSPRPASPSGAGAEPQKASVPLPEASGDLSLGAGPLSEPVKQLLAAIPSEELSFPDEHYFHSNEWRHDLLEPHLDGLGGALIGVGADQNYTMAALASSELLLLVDFDPRIPRLHRIYQVLIGASETPDGLLERFSDAGAAEAEALLARELADDPEQAALVEQFRRFRPRWSEYLRRVRRLERGGRPFGWLADPEAYGYIRRVFAEGRVVARAGDVTGAQTLRTMGAALRRLETPAQVVYFSNAEQFFPYSDDFVENIRAMPATDRSVVVRTTRHQRLPNVDSDRWHYIVQRLDDFQGRLATGAYPRAASLLSDLLAAGPPHLSLSTNGVSVITAEVPRREAERARRQ